MGTMTKNPSAPVPAADLEPDSALRRDERRSHDRFDVEWAVDCIAEDTFLYASITNISAMGIFVKTTDPLAIGTRLVLAFAPPGLYALQARGRGRVDQPAALERRQPQPRHRGALRESAAGRPRAPRRGDPDDRLRARTGVASPRGWPPGRQGTEEPAMRLGRASRSLLIDPGVLGALAAPPSGPSRRLATRVLMPTTSKASARAARAASEPAT